MSSPRGPAPNDLLQTEEAKEGVRDRASAARRARMMLMAASSGNCQQLRRGQILPPAPHELVIDVVAEPPALERGGVTEEATGSALHVVAAAGDSQRYKDSATVIHCRARHLLTARDGKGDTPLHCAARAGNTGMVAHLISLAGDEAEVRALVGARNVRGETALHEAVRFGDAKMVGALMEADRGLAAVAAKDGTSPMYLASSLGCPQIADVLHRLGDRVSYSGPDGQNALHAAVLHNHKGELCYPFVLNHLKKCFDAAIYE